MSPFHTSLPELDAALGPCLSPGHFLVCTGLTGGGKTVLAAQLAARMAQDDHRVLFVSTRVELVELQRRSISAGCDLPYDDVKDGLPTVQIPGTVGWNEVPDPTRFGCAATIKAAPLVDALNRNRHFVEARSVVSTPVEELDQHLAAYEREQGRMPEVVIYDYLRAPLITVKEGDIFEMRRAVVDVAKLLQAVAKERGVLVIAFCQANPTQNTHKKIGPGDVREYRDINELADAHIGISHRRRSDNDVEDGGPIRERIQHLTVVTTERPRAVLVPVIANFAFQRFDPYVKPSRSSPGTGEEDLRSDLERKAAAIAATSEFPGYVLARRNVLHQVFACGVPYAASLYGVLLLVANRDGISFYGREKLSELTGLSIKQLRTAMDVLGDRSLVDVPPARFHKSLSYGIENWRTEQNPANQGYFKLFRNLRDASRAELLGNPALFRTWLYLLCEARAFDDEAAELMAGEVLIKPRRACEVLCLKEGEFDENLAKLQARGSVRTVAENPRKLALVNWGLYQSTMYPSGGEEGVNKPAFSSGRARANARQVPGRAGATEGQLRKMG